MEGNNSSCHEMNNPHLVGNKIVNAESFAWCPSDMLEGHLPSAGSYTYMYIPACLCVNV